MTALGGTWRRWWAIGLVAVASGAAVAGTLEGRAGPYRLTVTVAPDPPTVGSNTVAVRVHDRGGKPVDDASVVVTASMVGMDMGSTPYPAVRVGDAGGYESQANLTMAGTWSLDVAVSAGGRGQGHQAFRITTGNPVHQAPVSGRRAVWLWLLAMILAPTLVALLPERVLAHERRGVVAGTLLLIGAVGFARTVVQVYRRPGQMSVIESQAMDMSAMKPPVGAVPVVTETLRFESFEGGITATGSAVAYAQQDVTPRVTGVIVDMPAYPGDRVRAGDVLARLDTRELGSRQNEALLAHLAAQEAAGAARQDARSATAATEQAQSELQMAEQRIVGMTAEKASAEAMVRRSEQEYAAAQARLVQAQRSVEAAQAGQRTKSAMSDEGKAMVRSAEADQSVGGKMVDEANADLAAARREVTEAERMADAARAGQEQAEASAGAAQAELPQAEADLAQMRADLTFEDTQLGRMASLLKQGAISQEEYDREKAMRDGAAAKVARAEAMVTGTRRRIAADAAMARQAGFELAAAGERRGKAEEMVRAAQAKLEQVKGDLAGRGAMVNQREAGVRSRTAEEEEAASMTAMRQAEVTTMAADIKAAAAAIEQARADSAKADAGIAEMRAARDRAAGMIRERQAMAEASMRRSAEAERRAAQARAAAFTAETIASYTAVRANLDGVVTERITSPSTLVQPGTLLLRVAQIDQMRLQANVAQNEAEAVRVGAAVEVTPRKSPDVRDRTMVSAAFPSSNPSSRTRIVEALIDNRDGAYLPGDFVTLRIATSSKAGRALSVPTKALVHIIAPGGAANAADQPAVWVVRGGGGGGKTEYYCTMHPEVVSDKPGQCPKCKMDLTPRQATAAAAAGAAKTEYYCTMHPEVVSDKPGQCPKCKMDLTPRQVAGGGGGGGSRAHRVAITTGRTNGDRIEVTSGLQAGDQIIVSGLPNLREGDVVTIIAPPEGTPPPALLTMPGGRDRTPTFAASRPAAGESPAPAARAAHGGGTAAPTARTQPAARPTAPKAVYTCPMDPDVVRSAPGSCPKCGMDLVKKSG